MARTRQDRADNFYRQMIRKYLLRILRIMNPEDQMEYSKLKYPELIRYALDFLNTELAEVDPGGPPAHADEPKVSQNLSLSLE